jgi:hypothetical protein
MGATIQIMRRSLSILAVFFCIPLASCGGGGGGNSPAPAEVTFTFRLHGAPASEEFRIRSSSQTFISAARMQLSLPEPQRHLFPVGGIASGSGGVNLAWSWHFNDATLSEVAIELCDGRPSFVEADLNYWLNTVHSFCPWSAYVYAELP